MWEQAQGLTEGWRSAGVGELGDLLLVWRDAAIDVDAQVLGDAADDFVWLVVGAAVAFSGRAWEQLAADQATALGRVFFGGFDEHALAFLDRFDRFDAGRGSSLVDDVEEGLGVAVLAVGTKDFVEPDDAATGETAMELGGKGLDLRTEQVRATDEVKTHGQCDALHPLLVAVGRLRGDFADLQALLDEVLLDAVNEARELLEVVDHAGHEEHDARSIGAEEVRTQRTLVGLSHVSNPSGVWRKRQVSDDLDIIRCSSSFGNFIMRQALRRYVGELFLCQVPPESRLVLGWMVLGWWLYG